MFLAHTVRLTVEPEAAPSGEKDMLLSGAAQAESRTESPGDEFTEPVPIMFCWITTIL